VLQYGGHSASTTSARRIIKLDQIDFSLSVGSALFHLVMGVVARGAGTLGKKKKLRYWCGLNV